ncbi:hypothetical protein JCM6882_003189 [Rhodosporidiobolus microsporus]
MPARPHLTVKLAQKVTPDDLLSKLRTSYGTSGARGKRVEVVLRDEKRAALAVHTAKSLPSPEQAWAWELFEQNMKALYEASEDGYDPAEKRKELFHADSRFLVLYSGSAPTPQEKPLGYCIFRFDTEETASEDDDELCDVAYCYELQVDPSARRLGAGKTLMDALERLGKACKMDKTMLTVFKANTEAIAFYKSVGFDTDEIDPVHYGEDVDYCILSKPCTYFSRERLDRKQREICWLPPSAALTS